MYFLHIKLLIYTFSHDMHLKMIQLLPRSHVHLIQIEIESMQIEFANRVHTMKIFNRAFLLEFK